MAVCAFTRCGKPLTSDNPRAKFCGPTCRAGAHKAARRSGGLAALPAPTSADTSVRAAVLADLTEAERADTVLGRAALALAARIDRAADTGSALASTVKQLEVTLNSAMAGAAVANTAADDLRARRDAKRRGA